MIDKELEAIYKCHEHLNELSNDSKLRVFKYLLDRYNLVPNSNSFINQNTENEEIPLVESKIDDQPKKKNNNSKKNTTGNSSNKSYKLVPSLNLVSKGELSLKDFFEKYHMKSNLERNTIFVYYLERILEEDNIGQNHVYTCYKTLSIKVPNIYQSLIDTKNKKGWLNTENIDDLSVTVAGENYIEHEISKS